MSALDQEDTEAQRRSSADRRQSSEPSKFVLGTSPAGVRHNNPRSGEKQSNGGYFGQTDDDNHQVALLEHLSSDLGNLLNRTDISDCYLNVKGTKICYCY